MLTGKCINPEIMKAVSLLGHGDRILIADGNYPLESKTGEAKKLWIGLCPGMPTVTDVLDVLQSVITVEAAYVMQTESGDEPEVFGEFRQMLKDVELEALCRFDFYEECGKSSLRFAISTGEKRTFSNILLTVGVA